MLNKFCYCAMLISALTWCGTVNAQVFPGAASCRDVLAFGAFDVKTNMTDEQANRSLHSFYRNYAAGTNSETTSGGGKGSLSLFDVLDLSGEGRNNNANQSSYTTDLLTKTQDEFAKSAHSATYARTVSEKLMDTWKACMSRSGRGLKISGLFTERQEEILISMTFVTPTTKVQSVVVKLKPSPNMKCEQPNAAITVDAGTKVVRCIRRGNAAATVALDTDYTNDDGSPVAFTLPSLPPQDKVIADVNGDVFANMGEISLKVALVSVRALRSGAATGRFSYNRKGENFSGEIVCANVSEPGHLYVAGPIRMTDQSTSSPWAAFHIRLAAKPRAGIRVATGIASADWCRYPSSTFDATIDLKATTLQITAP